MSEQLCFSITSLILSQLLFHTFPDENGDDFDCCAMEESQRHPNCMPMMIPEDDKFYSRFSRTCMDFKRSIAGQRPNCALGEYSCLYLSFS